MAKNISKRKPLSGNNRSHAMNATKRQFGLNLQTVVVDGKKVRLSTREIRTLRKQGKLV